MGQTYTRQSAFSDGDTITASLFNNEFDQLVNAFNNSTGHTHDGTAGEGGPITVVGPNQDVSFGSTAVLPANNNTVNLGSASFQFKDGYFDGVVTLDGLVIGTSTSVTSVDTDLTSVSASDDTLASAKAIKAYVDAVATAADLDFQADTGGALSIDLDSETLTIAGTANEIETAGSGNTVTIGLPNNVTIGNNLTVTNNLITNNDVQFTGTAGNIIFDKSADTLGLQDDVYLAFGDDDDFKIYHNGTNTVLVDANATSTIVVANDLGVSITNAAGTTPSATFVPSGAATLNYAGSAKVATKTDGIDVTGEVQSDSLDVDGNADISGNLVIGGNTTIGDANTDNVTVNAVVASDLVPYADGTYDLGSASLEWQDLYIDGTAHVDAINYDGTLITATAAELNILDGVTATATEINLLDGVTATTAEINRLDVTTVGALEANKVLTADASGNINFSSANMTNVDIDSGTIDGATINTSNITVPATKTLDVSAGTLTLANDQISGDKVEGGTIAAITITDLTTATVTTTGATTVGGNLTVTGDLTVNGTTTTINSTTLDVDDINITVAKGAADAAAANGAGLTVDGASATITYNSTDDDWDFNKGIALPDDAKLQFGAGSDLQIYHDGAISWIKDNGTGNLKIQTNGSAVIIEDANNDTLANFNNNGSAYLAHVTGGVSTYRLQTTSTGIDVTGTVTADKAVLSLANNDPLSLENTSGTRCRIQMATASSHAAEIDLDGGNLKFKNTASDLERLRISSNGDISFYEDTGTNASFVYDADTELVVNEDSRDFDFRVESDTNSNALFVQGSDGRVGIGTGSPVSSLHVSGSGIINQTIGSSNSRAGLALQHAGTTVGAMYTDTNALVFGYGAAWASNEAMRIDSNGNVGINEDNPVSLLHMNMTGKDYPRVSDDTGWAGIECYGGGGSDNYARMHNYGSEASGTIIENIGTGPLRLTTGSTEVVRLFNNQAIINESSADVDFRVESNSNTHMLFVDGGNNRVGIGMSTPSRTFQVNGAFYPTFQVAHNNSYNSGSGGVGYVKLGRISIGGSSTAQIKVYGTQSYSSGADISGCSTIDIRGDNSSTTLGGNFYTLTGGNHGIMEAGYVYVSDNLFDIYIRVSTFQSVEYTTVTGATWTDDLTFTNSETAPTGWTEFNRRVDLLIGTTRALTINDSNYVVNDGSHDMDFRVESNDNANMLFVDGGNNRVGIGTNSPNAKLDVSGALLAPAEVRITNVGGTWTADDEIGRYSFYTTDASGIGARELASIRSISENSGATAGGALAFYTSPYNTAVGERLVIHSNGGLTQNTGGVVLNEYGGDNDFRVESDIYTHALFVDAGNNRVGINNSSPNQAFDVNGALGVGFNVVNSSNLCVAEGRCTIHVIVTNQYGTGSAVRSSAYYVTLNNEGTAVVDTYEVYNHNSNTATFSVVSGYVQIAGLKSGNNVACAIVNR